MANVYDGLSRAPLRVGLALVGAADAIGLAVQVHRTGESELSHGFAPRFLFAMHDHPLSLIALVVLAVAGLLSFAARRRPITSGLVAVGAIAVLSESHAALVGGPARSFYTVGAVLFGWVFGLAYARGIAANGFRREAANEESLAETGAVGVFAATYFGAGVSKLLLGGVDWADPNHLRAIVVSQHPVADNSVLGTYADVVTNHGAVSAAFALATLVVQLGAVMLLVSPFMRKLWCAAILGFHLNTLLLAHIVYLEAVVIALLFGYPWPAIVARLRGRTASAPVEPPSTPASQRGTRVTLATAICFFGVLAGVGSLPAVRRYTGEHHRARTRPQDRQGRAPDTAL
ncbi:MAG TPA: hypothetical protein VHU80_19210, partial [Polyangiaceae bacterium]|nr:hypothetical protein [Polyangiaceae bacterium]